MTRSGSTYYYMADALGSVRNVLDADEGVQNFYDYYAFGNTLGTPTTGVTNPCEYTGREFEDGSVNTTLYYRNRYYMSALGIFVSRDDIGYDLGAGWIYVHQNPAMKSDALGLFDPVSVGTAIATFGGAVATALDIYYGAGTLKAYEDAWVKDCDYCKDLAAACSPRWLLPNFPASGLDQLCLSAFGPGGECAGISAGTAGLASYLASKTPGTTATGPAANPPTGQ